MKKFALSLLIITLLFPNKSFSQNNDEIAVAAAAGAVSRCILRQNNWQRPVLVQRSARALQRQHVHVLQPHVPVCPDQWRLDQTDGHRASLVARLAAGRSVPELLHRHRPNAKYTRMPLRPGHPWLADTANNNRQDSPDPRG